MRDIKSSILVSHRSEPSQFPENSILGFQYVIQNGSVFIEADIQISANGIAFLSHDDSLYKFAGRADKVTELTSQELLEIPASYESKFAQQYKGLTLSTLSELVSLLIKHPDATAFIELKEESIQAHGIQFCVSTLLLEIDSILDQCVLISFNIDCLYETRKQSSILIGWVLPKYDEVHHQYAKDLNPEYLFVNTNICPEPPKLPWHGDWKWAAYTVNSASKVSEFLNAGYDLVETNYFSKMVTKKSEAS